MGACLSPAVAPPPEGPAERSAPALPPELSSTAISRTVVVPVVAETPSPRVYGTLRDVFRSIASGAAAGITRDGLRALFRRVMRSGYAQLFACVWCDRAAVAAQRGGARVARV